MRRLSHSIRLKNGRLECLLKPVEGNGRQSRRAGADEANLGQLGRYRGGKEDGVDGRYGGPPVASVVDEVGPEFVGGKAWWDHDACT